MHMLRQMEAARRWTFVCEAQQRGWTFQRNLSLEGINIGGCIPLRHQCCWARRSVHYLLQQSVIQALDQVSVLNVPSQKFGISHGQRGQASIPLPWQAGSHMLVVRVHSLPSLLRTIPAPAKHWSLLNFCTFAPNPSNLRRLNREKLQYQSSFASWSISACSTELLQGDGDDECVTRHMHAAGIVEQPNPGHTCIREPRPSSRPPPQV